jgi:hypothetical protein
MRTTMLFTLFLAAALWARATAGGEPALTDIKVEAQGVRVIKPVAGNDRLRPLNGSGGTTVALLVTSPQGGLCTMEYEESKITSFTDDKGKDLTPSEKKSSSFDRTGFEMSPSVGEDGKQCLANAHAPGQPTKGASSVTVSGEIVVQMATQKKDFAAENIALQPGTPVNAGPIPFLVMRATGLAGTWSVTLQAKQDLASIAEIQFFESNGKKIEARRGGWQRSAHEKNITVSWDYSLKTTVDTVKIVITCWSDMKKVAIPFKLTAGMGL